MLGTHYAIVYTKGRGEQSIIYRERIIKSKWGSGHGVAAFAWGDHDTGSKSQIGGNLDYGGKGEEWLYRHVVS